MAHTTDVAGAVATPVRALVMTGSIDFAVAFWSCGWMDGMPALTSAYKLRLPWRTSTLRHGAAARADTEGGAVAGKAARAPSLFQVLVLEMSLFFRPPPHVRADRF